jgi:GDPmannose 4,6-dehydratase
MKRALICGISGQDGAYLAKFLIEKGYEVFGTSRDAQMENFVNLDILNIKEKIILQSMSIIDFRSVLQVIMRVKPNEIYNLAGQSSVGLSFEQPVETLESITIGTLNLLEAIRLIDHRIKLYNACSGECFGDTGNTGATEETPFKPKSPYAVAKAAAFWEGASYRESYGLFVCSGLLFNHESPLRPHRFVTRKIVSTACKIANDSKEKLFLGNMDIERDWGWAPEYVEAMYLMLQQSIPEDFVIATGTSNSLKDFVRITFEKLNLNWEDHTVVEKTLLRPSDHLKGLGNPKKANEKLNWRAKNKLEDIVEMMIQTEIDYLKKNH